MNQNPEMESYSDTADVAQVERRRHPRHSVEHVFEPADSAAGSSPAARFWARMVDISDGGIGVEMVVSLQAGTVAFVTGELHSNRFCVGLHGRVRIAYYREVRHGIYRIGLEFQGTSCSNLACAHAVGSHGWLPGTPMTDDGTVVEISRGIYGMPRKVYIQTRVWGNLDVTPVG